MDILALLGVVAKFILLLAGLLVPGAAVMRALGVPRTIGTSFAGSAAAFYTTLLGLELAGVPTSVGTLFAGVALIAFVAEFFVRRASRVSSLRGGLRDENARLRWVVPVPFTRMGVWLPLYLAFWVIVIWRACHEPLAGPDIEFRWSFLAEQLLERGSFDFYPPRSADDFAAYFWAESIPPGVSALHAWAYACAGEVSPGWTVPAVLLQVWTLHELLWRTTERLAGVRAARLACMAAVASPLLTWSLLLGQETGLTAIALIGIVFALHGWQLSGASGWAALAGIFAVLGAAAREYGLIFPALAGAGLLALRADRRAWFSFSAVAMLALVWPLRTLLLTGNPFYSLEFAALSTNARFVEWIDFDANAFAVLRTAEGWRDVGHYLVQFAPAALVGLVVLIPAVLRGNPFRREACALLTAAVVVLVVWGFSVRFTNGGLFYSLRVTSPALAVGTLVTGITLAAVAMARPRVFTGASLALGLLCIGTLPSTLALPRNPWRATWREWPTFAPRVDAVVGKADPVVALVLRSPDCGVVLADAPGFQRRFAPLGIQVIPPWSPAADWLFDTTLPAEETIRRWRASGVRHVLVTKWGRNLEFFNTRSRWNHAPFRVQLVGETDDTAVFSLHAGL